MSNPYSKNNHCECGKLISNNAKKCSECYHKSQKGKKYPQLSKQMKGKNNPHFKDGRCLKKHYYCECGNEVCMKTALYGSGLCRICGNKIRKPHKVGCQCCCCKNKRGELKGKNTSRFIDGRCSIKHNCIDCGKEISYKAKKCKKCSSKLNRLGKVQTKKTRQIIRDKLIKRMLTNGGNYKNTLIEIIMKRVLSNLKIKFIHQFPIRNKNGTYRFLVDFYLPKYNLIIECDGDYWHNLPNIKKRDKIKNKWFNDNKYKILRFSESKIKNDLINVKDRLKEKLLEFNNGHL
jgi:very-short-patch-repair endonuclease